MKVRHLMVSGSTISSMVLEKKLGKMDPLSLRESMSKEKNAVKDATSGQMEVSTTANF